MRVTEHIEHLLRQGKKPGELVDLGFSKRVITRVRRQLQKEKAAATATKSGRGTKDSLEASAVSVDSVAVMKADLASAKRDIQTLERCVEELQTRLDNTLTAGIRRRFECDGCGSEGLVAVRIRCTKCGRETWLGWWPQK